MVKGLDKFREHFSEYTDHYTIIGGTACFWNLQSEGLGFRVTRDIDMIVVLENYDAIFNRHLWKFFVDGKYSNLQKELTEQKFYRFVNPENKEYPNQIEILCRRPEAITLPESIKVTAIDPKEYFSHLSAIILDDEYYGFTISHSYLLNGLHISGVEALICLKAYAYLNLRNRKEQGEAIDGSDISKHKKDVFRLGAALRNPVVNLPVKIRSDLQLFVELMEHENPEVGGLLKLMGVTDLTREDILSNIKQSFGL